MADDLPPLARALRSRLDEAGLTTSDFLRELGYPGGDATVRQAVEGDTAKPNRQLRDLIDSYFGAPPGHTLRIITGRVEPRYPNPNRLARMAEAVAEMSDVALDRFVDFVAEVRRAGR